MVWLGGRSGAGRGWSRSVAGMPRAIATAGPAPALIAALTPGGHGGPDDVAAVVPAGDAVEGLDVDGVGRADGRLQFGAAGNAAGHGSHLRMIGGVTGIVVQSPRTPLPFPGTAARPRNGIDCYGMVPDALDTNGMDSNGMDSNGMDSNGMDSRPFVVGDAAAEEDVVTQRKGMLPVTGGKSTRLQDPFFRPTEAAKRPQNARWRLLLRIYVRRAIITLIAHLLACQNRPYRRPLMTTAPDLQLVPASTVGNASAARR